MQNIRILRVRLEALITFWWNNFFLHLFLHNTARCLITIPLLCTASVFIQFVFKNMALKMYAPFLFSYPESVVLWGWHVEGYKGRMFDGGTSMLDLEWAFAWEGFGLRKERWPFWLNIERAHRVTVDFPVCNYE